MQRILKIVLITLLSACNDITGTSNKQIKAPNLLKYAVDCGDSLRMRENIGTCVSIGRAE